SMISMKEKKKLLKPGSPIHKPQEYTAPFYAKVQDKGDVTKMQYLDLHVWLAGDILLKSDRMSMANSLELRVPFLDKEVWEVARHLPLRQRVNASNTKVALRAAAERRLPKDTAQRRKLGFPVPIRIWLKEEPYYSRVKEYFTSESAATFFQTKELLAMLEEHRAGKADKSRAIWTVLMFLCWYEIYFKGASHELGDAF
ncbi:MAG: asparagine synthase C-terminal domain-containing protein, partial [Blautia sp.]|nr:asparagine synthase C-terminal domain-containing protein [Blautia sp.]